MAIQDYYIARNDKGLFLKPRLHYTAPKGWLNDPNGLIYSMGKYHLFYQHLVDNLDWTKVCTHWGHAVSDDMIHWHDLPIALSPDKPYELDTSGGGCFSGSAIEWEGKLYLFYTGSVGDGDSLRQTQNMAFSEDGVHFEKYAGNPLIPSPPSFGRRDFRDPKVFRHDGMFYMIVAGSVGETVESAAACVYIYRSQDLYNWEYLNIVVGPTKEYGTMIECPDFFPLGDRWVLSACLMNNAQYQSNVFFVGNMDFSSGTFEILRTQVQDLNRYWYAPQTFADAEGRRIQMCWQNTCLWMQWFDDWGPTIQEGWRSCLSLPHILSIDDSNFVHSVPISIDSEFEVEYTVEALELCNKPHIFSPKDPFCYQLCFRLNASECFSGRIELGLMGCGETHSKLSLDLPGRKVILDVKDRRDKYGSGIVIADLPEGDDLFVRLQLDRSSLEICFNDSTHLVACVYPEQEQQELWIRTPYTRALIRDIKLSSYNDRS